jgi:hypothetical protein
MGHIEINKLNEFVAIKREGDGTFSVEYGMSDLTKNRYICSDFKSVNDAIAWIERLDSSTSHATNGARHFANAY